MRRQKLIVPILVTSAVWLAIGAVGVFAAQKYLVIENPSAQVPVYRAAHYIGVNSTITSDDIILDYVDPSSLSQDAVQSEDQLKDKKVVIPIYSNEQVITDRLIENNLNVSSDSVLYVLPLTAQTSAGNTLKATDTVDIMVNYQKALPSDVIVPKIRIFKLVTSDGSLVTGDTKTSPAYAQFYVSRNDLKMLDDAAKRGTVYPVKYADASSPASIVTYKPTYQ